MKRHPLVLVLVVVAFVSTLSISTPTAAAAEDQGLRTRATLITGFPDDDAKDTQGVLVVPGTVIPVDQGPDSKVQVEEDRSAMLGKLASQLSSTFRLSRIDIAYTQPLTLSVGRRESLSGPSLTSGIRITVELLGLDRDQATYQVRFDEGGKSLADSRVLVRRGEKAVVGGVDGPEAPYFFLVLEPMNRAAAEEDGPFQVSGDIRHPRAVHKVAPEYPEEARKVRVQGVVIVQTVIDAEGRVQDVKVLKGLPYGLSEAAVEAVRQWRFEPARDGEDNPVPVYYNLTVNFVLDKDSDDE